MSVVPGQAIVEKKYPGHVGVRGLGSKVLGLGVLGTQP